MGKKMQAWEKLLTFFEQELGKDTVDQWLRPLSVQRFDACNLYLQAEDSFQALWFEEHIRRKAEARFVNNNNKKITIHLSVKQDKVKGRSQKTPAKEKKAEKTISPLRFSIEFDELDPLCTFDAYEVLAGNKLAIKLLRDITGYNSKTETQEKAQLDALPFNPIYLYGPKGLGKTHLLMATAHSLKEQGFKVTYSRAETFTEHVVNAIRAGEMQAFRKAYRNTDALLIDGVEIFSRKGATQEELFHTFNTLHVEGKLIILSANCAPCDLKLIEPRLVSRFEWGIVVPLDPLAKEEREKVLYKKAKALDFRLEADQAEFLLDTFKSSTKSVTRALEAIVLRRHLYQSSGKAAPHERFSVDLMQEFLKDLISEEKESTLTPDKIINTVAEHYGIRAEDILSKSQSRECAVPRQIAMHMIRTQLRIPFMRIGDIFSRDHSTVMSSVKQVQKTIDENDEEIAGDYNTVLKQVKSK